MGQLKITNVLLKDTTELPSNLIEIKKTIPVEYQNTASIKYYMEDGGGDYLDLNTLEITYERPFTSEEKNEEKQLQEKEIKQKEELELEELKRLTKKYGSKYAEIMTMSDSDKESK